MSGQPTFETALFRLALGLYGLSAGLILGSLMWFLWSRKH